MSGRGEMFTREAQCWICGGTSLSPVTEAIFELGEYTRQDPELAAYTGKTVAIDACARCGFAQPHALPALERYFDRMYDQRWSLAWIRDEFESTAKDFIFQGVLRELATRLASDRRRLLDVGAHAGRFVALARQRHWLAEGVELNPQTAAYAAARTGAPIRRLNITDLDPVAEQFDAVTLTDVLEHVPFPLDVLRTAATLLAPGGWIAVKVPCGSAQLAKEAWRARLRPSYRPTIADNLVHVSHFSPHSLRLALQTAGFTEVTVRAGAPEFPAGRGLAFAMARTFRGAIYAAARGLPGGVRTPLALNLQAFGRRP